MPINKKKQLFLLYSINFILWGIVVFALSFIDVLRPIYKAIASADVYSAINAISYTKYDNIQLSEKIGNIHIKKDIEQKIYSDKNLTVISLDKLESKKVDGEYFSNITSIYLYNNIHTYNYKGSILFHELMHYIYDNDDKIRLTANTIIKNTLLNNKEALYSYIAWGTENIDNEYSKSDLLNIKKNNDIISKNCILNSLTYNMHLYINKDDNLLKQSLTDFINNIDTLNLKEENILFNETFAVCLQNYYISLKVSDSDELNHSILKGRFSLGNISDVDFNETYMEGDNYNLINLIFDLK